MKIDDKLKGIRPYVLSMRYQDILSIVDVKLKEGWKVPKTEAIGIKEYPDYPNTYMFFSDNDSVGIDEILTFIEEVVRINIEREKKMALLTEKTAELRDFFMRHSLEELERLKFKVEEEVKTMAFDDFTPSKLNMVSMIDEEGMKEEVLPEPIEEDIVDEEEMIREESN